MSTLTEPKMKITALASWFGSNRMLAPLVGKELEGCRWVGIPFAGGMSELAHIKASTIVVSDLHRHVMNLACILSMDGGADWLAQDLAKLPFHPDTLTYAQLHCVEMERGGWSFGKRDAEADQRWAVNYFVTCWMGRSAKAGTDDEFKGGLPVRWSASGGDSNTRYRSAIESLDAWGAIMRRCNFVVQDVFEFLDNVKDETGHGLYLDPPFPGPGDAYRHKFDEAKHRLLAPRLSEFKSCRVVCRFYDHPLVRELYPESRWAWKHSEGRTQSNGKAPEVLIVNHVPS